MSYYRIGDFAKKLGVTPDFLKYYEKVGILHPEVNNSGYRYYSFAQTSKVLECVKLRNFGFSSQEIVNIMNSSSFHEYVSYMCGRGSDIQREANFCGELLKVIEELRLAEQLLCVSENWEVRLADGFFFLPYSVQDKMIDDARVSEILLNWLPWMPVVKSGTAYKVLESPAGQLQIDHEHMPVIGIIVSENFARSQGLITDLPVEYVHSHRSLIIYLRSRSLGRKAVTVEEQALNPTRSVAELIKKHNLKVCGSFYSYRLAMLDETDGCWNYTVTIVPIE